MVPARLVRPRLVEWVSRGRKELALGLPLSIDHRASGCGE